MISCIVLQAVTRQKQYRTIYLKVIHQKPTESGGLLTTLYWPASTPPSYHAILQLATTNIRLILFWHRTNNTNWLKQRKWEIHAPSRRWTYPLCNESITSWEKKSLENNWRLTNLKRTRTLLFGTPHSQSRSLKSQYSRQQHNSHPNYVPTTIEYNI